MLKRVLFAVYKFHEKMAAVDRCAPGKIREILRALMRDRHRRSSCLYASRWGGPFAPRTVINSPVARRRCSRRRKSYVRIAVEYVSEFVPRPARLPPVLFTRLFMRVKLGGKYVSAFRATLGFLEEELFLWISPLFSTFSDIR